MKKKYESVVISTIEVTDVICTSNYVEVIQVDDWYEN